MIIIIKLLRSISVAREDQRGENKIIAQSLSQDGYTRRPCPPGRDATRHKQNKTRQNKKKNQKVKSSTKTRLATHQDKQDMHLSQQERQKNKTKPKHNQIAFIRSSHRSLQYDYYCCSSYNSTTDRLYLLCSRPGTFRPCLPSPSCFRQPRLSYFVDSGVVVSLSCPPRRRCDKKQN